MKMMLVAVAAAAIGAAGCSSSADDVTTNAAAGDNGEVSVENFAFNPGTISVAAGTEVTWTNDETGVAHTTTSDDDVWNSGTLQPGDDFTVTFADPGTFTYFCSIHPSMTATIVVEG
jgi:plastocyanin